MPSSTAEIDRPLRLLSLDGGGIRGLSTLLILRRLMHAIRREDDLYKLPKPCQYFDLICGTSTGGLIAIMLGRLEMDVQSCIDAYCELSRDVFKDDNMFGKLGRLSGRFIKAAGGKPWFDAAKLETAVKSIVHKRLNDPNAPLTAYNSLKKSSNVFVVATRAGSATPVLLRSYQSAEESYNLAIWEACRATAAAPLFFEPIKVGKSPQVEFVDGALGNNNPVNLLVNEARDLWPSSPFAVILSVGTGKPQMKAVGTKATDVLATCIRLATEAEDTAREFRKRQPHMVKMHKYFRFNVEQGLQNVGMEEWKALGTIVEPATMAYLDEVQGEIVKCAEILKNPKNIFINNGSLHDSIYDVPLKSSATFTGRTDILHSIEKCLLSLEASEDLRIVALYGLGGVGKTQIAIKYAELFRPRYKYVFWINSKSRETVEDSMTRIVSLLTAGRSLNNTNRAFGSILSIVERLIEAQGKWLLIYDNADFLDSFDLSKYFPPKEVGGIKTRGNIIITSRDPSSARLAIGGEAIEVGELPEEDAIDLLLQCACISDDENQRAYASEIVGELGHLALAIDQAGSFITKRKRTLSQYLDDFRTHRKDVLKFKPAKSLMAYSDTVFSTWEISYAYIEDNSPVAARLLNFFAFFDNTNISLEVIRKGCRTQGRWGVGGSLVSIPLSESTVPQWLIDLFHPDGAFDDFNYESQIQELRSFSLVQQNTLTRNLYIHPLVHEWSRLRLSRTDQSRVMYDAIGFLSHAAPVADVDDAIAEINHDLALINNYYMEARLWLTGKPRTMYEPHVAEVIRTDIANHLISFADMGPKLTTEYTFLLLRSPLHSTSFTDTLSFFAYRKQFIDRLTEMDPADREYFNALDVLSKTRCYADGSIFYFSIAQAHKVIDRVLPLKQLVIEKFNDGSFFQVAQRAPSDGPSTLADVLLTPGVQSVLEAGLKSYGSFVAQQKLEETARPFKRLRTRFQKFSGFRLDQIKDEDHEAWAEFAEGTCRDLLREHVSGAIHPDPRINAAYGEALIELALVRYFYNQEDGKKTMTSWSPTETEPKVPLVERFTDGRKRLWLKMVELEIVTNT